MLRTGYEIDPRVGTRREVERPIHGRVNQRGGAAVVFVGPIGVKHPRGGGGFFRPVEQALGEPGELVRLRRVGEWKQVGRMEKIEKRPGIAGRLGKPVVETAATGAGDM